MAPPSYSHPVSYGLTQRERDGTEVTAAHREVFGQNGENWQEDQGTSRISITLRQGALYNCTCISTISNGRFIGISITS